MMLVLKKTKANGTGAQRAGGIVIENNRLIGMYFRLPSEKQWTVVKWPSKLSTKARNPKKALAHLRGG